MSIAGRFPLHENRSKQLFFIFFSSRMRLTHTSHQKRAHRCSRSKRLENFFSLSLPFSFVSIEKKEKRIEREFRFFHLHIHLSVYCTSSSIHVKERRKTDGSSDHRDKKVVCVYVWIYFNLELTQIIDFTQSCFRDISGVRRKFFLRFPTQTSTIIAARCVCVHVETLKVFSFSSFSLFRN